MLRLPADLELDGEEGGIGWDLTSGGGSLGEARFFWFADVTFGGRTCSRLQHQIGNRFSTVVVTVFERLQSQAI